MDPGGRCSQGRRRSPRPLGSVPLGWSQQNSTKACVTEFVHVCVKMWWEGVGLRRDRCTRADYPCADTFA